MLFCTTAALRAADDVHEALTFGAQHGPQPEEWQGSARVVLDGVQTLALQPFGYVLTLDGEPLDDRPVDISQYTTLGFDSRQVVPLEAIPVLPTHEAFPGDYRTKNEIRRDVIVNILTQKGHPLPASEADRIISVGAGPDFLRRHGIDR